MEAVDRGTFHVRSNSSPDPLSEPWAESVIPSSVSLITPCTGGGGEVDPTCGLAEALEAILPFEANYNDDDHAFALESSAPTLSALTPNKISSDNLCAAQDAANKVVGESSSSSSTTQDSPEMTPAYQKRGRFLVWPVKMESPQLSLPLFGLARR